MFYVLKDSPYRTTINSAVLQLQEEGKLHTLKTHWWKEKRGGGSCRVHFFFHKNEASFNIRIVYNFHFWIFHPFQDDTSKSSSTANELGLANVGGVFVVLMGGMGMVKDLYDKIFQSLIAVYLIHNDNRCCLCCCRLRICLEIKESCNWRASHPNAMLLTIILITHINWGHSFCTFK